MTVNVVTGALQSLVGRPSAASLVTGDLGKHNHQVEQLPWPLSAKLGALWAGIMSPIAGR